MQDFILEGVLKQCKKQEEDMVTDRQERSGLNAVVFKAEFGFNSLRPTGWLGFTTTPDCQRPGLICVH